VALDRFTAPKQFSPELLITGIEALCGHHPIRKLAAIAENTVATDELFSFHNQGGDPRRLPAQKVRDCHISRVTFEMLLT
jgi:hypothetical protein